MRDVPQQPLTPEQQFAQAARHLLEVTRQDTQLVAPLGNLRQADIEITARQCTRCRCQRSNRSGDRTRQPPADQGRDQDRQQEDRAARLRYFERAEKFRTARHQREPVHRSIARDDQWQRLWRPVAGGTLRWRWPLMAGLERIVSQTSRQKMRHGTTEELRRPWDRPPGAAYPGYGARGPSASA